MKSCLGLLLVILITAAAIAVPQQINYQGFLTRPDGGVLDTVVSLTFRLYDAPTDGTELWSEIQSPCSVRAGSFSVQLGAVTPLTNVFDTTSVWLGITVGNDAEMTPRSQIASSAYAFVAARADTANYAQTAVIPSGFGRLDGDQTWTGVNIFENSANQFSGSGAGITNLDAGNVNSGILPDARLSSVVTVQGNNVNSPDGLVKLDAANRLPTADGSQVNALNADNIATGTLSDARLSSAVTLQGNDVNVADGLVKLDGSGQLPAVNGSQVTALDAANVATGMLADARLSNNVTVQGNSINVANGLVKLDASGHLPAIDGSQITALNANNVSTGTLPDERLSSTVTLQGNSFNAANQLVRLDGSSRLPIADGSQLSALNANNISTGTLADARLSNSVTVQGNNINVANGLVKLDASGRLPVSDGSQVAALNAGNISSGTLPDARLSGSVTTQGNSFNSANQLVRLDGATRLPAVDGSLLTNVTANLQPNSINDSHVMVGANIAPSKIAGTAWTSNNDGAGSGLDADLVDGQHASAFLSAANDYGRSGVAPDLFEGATTLTAKYINEGQSAGGDLTGTFPNPAIANNAVTSAKILDGTIQAGDLNFVPGDITGVTAGTGLNGGGPNGSVTLNVNVPLALSGSSGSAIISGSNSGSSYGVYGTNGGNWGLLGSSNAGAYGQSSGGNYGYLGHNSAGAYGQSGSNYGYLGTSSGGAYGQNSNGNWGRLGASAGGAYGQSGSNYGYLGTTNGAEGSHSSGNYGLLGTSTVGVYGYKSGGGNYAGYFNGNVGVTGTLSKGGGSFKIDHPLDPAGKYLYHSFVESPDMMNIYNGNVLADANGEAWVDLPLYFEVLNRDFRYQLTAIGQPGPNLYIAQEISGNRFQIAGGRSGMKISWQVTGIRHDAFAEAHRIQIEVEKTGDERGKYLYPKEYGVSETQGIDYENYRKTEEQRDSEQVKSQATPRADGK